MSEGANWRQAERTASRNTGAAGLVTASRPTAKSDTIPLVPNQYIQTMQRRLVRAAIRGECPSCASKNVRRVARTGFAEILYYPRLGLWPYRCTNCYLRFLDSQRFPIPQTLSE